jgi:hypothetical protein
MAQKELVPYTEEELYVVAKKEAKRQPGKVFPLPPPAADGVHTKARSGDLITTNGNFFKQNRKLLINICVLVMGVGIYCYYQHQRNLAKQNRKR